MRKAPSSPHLTDAASESGGLGWARVPSLRATLAPFLPHPLRGWWLGSRKAAVRGGGGRNREAAAPPAGAGRLRSHRAALALKVEPTGSPRTPLSARSTHRQPRFCRSKFPWRSGPERSSSAGPADISLIPLLARLRPPMPRYWFQQSQWIVPCWYRGIRG